MRNGAQTSFVITIGMLLLAATATSAAQAQPTPSTELITSAGWECLSGTRVANGTLVIAPGATSLSRLNDYALRLQTSEDMAISITVEADTAFGFAGL